MVGEVVEAVEEVAGDRAPLRAGTGALLLDRGRPKPAFSTSWVRGACRRRHVSIASKTMPLAMAHAPIRHVSSAERRDTKALGVTTLPKLRRRSKKRRRIRWNEGAGRRRRLRLTRRRRVHRQRFSLLLFRRRTTKSSSFLPTASLDRRKRRTRRRRRRRSRRVSSTMTTATASSLLNHLVLFRPAWRRHPHPPIRYRLPDSLFFRIRQIRRRRRISRFTGYARVIWGEKGRRDGNTLSLVSSTKSYFIRRLTAPRTFPSFRSIVCLHWD